VNIAKGRPPVLDRAPSQWPFLCYGAAIAAVFILLMMVSKKHPASGRILLGLGQTFLGLFFGLAGSIAFFMALFTDHDYSWHNINIVFINPLVLAAVPLGLTAAFSKKEGAGKLSQKLLKGLWTYVFFAGVLTIPAGLLPGRFQQNLATLALALPFSLTLSFIPQWFRKRRRVTEPSAYGA
jgi:hypothetical protein